MIDINNPGAANQAMKVGEQQLFSHDGYCPICMGQTTFVALDAWLRDSYLCKRCRTIPRQRALVEVLNRVRPQWRQMRLHESSPSLLFFRDQCPGYSCSFYFEGFPVGRTREGIRCENLEQLTFPADSFDIFVTQDVLEHVFRPDLALREIMRVLRRGGVHIFTAPKQHELRASLARAQLVNNEIAHLQDPQYHGNPIADGKSLVAWNFGMDLDELIKQWSGYLVSTCCLRDRTLGIDGEYLEVFVQVKEPVNRVPMKQSNV